MGDKVISLLPGSRLQGNRLSRGRHDGCAGDYPCADAGGALFDFGGDFVAGGVRCEPLEAIWYRDTGREG